MEPSTQTVVPTFVNVDSVKKINENIGKVFDLRKSFDISIAEIYCDIAKNLANMKNDKSKYDESLRNVILSGAITKYELDDAKQLIKINGIEKYYDLGWKQLSRVRLCQQKSEKLDFIIGESKWGDLHDYVNLECFLISRIFANSSIRYNPEILKKYVSSGLVFEYLINNQTAIDELKNSKNTSKTLFRIFHNALVDDVKNKMKKSKKIHNDQAKLSQFFNLLEKIIKDDNRLNYIDEALVFDIAFNSCKLLDKMRDFYDGEYKYGKKYETDEIEINNLIDQFIEEVNKVEK